jgi:hypothetical protein
MKQQISDYDAPKVKINYNQSHNYETCNIVIKKFKV